MKACVTEAYFEPIELLEDDADIGDVDGEESGRGDPVVNE